MAEQLYPGIAFSPQAALADNIGAADTIIRVTDVFVFPDAPNLATIGTDEEGETVLYAAKTADALSGCVRGVEGTARAWSAGETIGRNFTAKDHNDLIAALQDAQGAAQTAAEAKTEAQEASRAAAAAQTAAQGAGEAAASAAEDAQAALEAAQGAATMEQVDAAIQAAVLDSWEGSY